MSAISISLRILITVVGMIRRLFNIGVAISLILFVIVFALWLRGFWRQDMVIFGRRGGAATVVEINGYCIRLTRVDAWPVRGAIGWHTALPPNSSDPPLVSRIMPSPAAVERDCFWAVMCSGEIVLEGPDSANQLYWQLPLMRFAGSGLRLGKGWLISIPFTTLFGATLILPALWVSLRIRRRLVMHRRCQLGVCTSCGYDLRAHKPGHRCPECGTPIPPKTREAELSKTPRLPTTQTTVESPQTSDSPK